MVFGKRVCRLEQVRREENRHDDHAINAVWHVTRPDDLRRMRHLKIYRVGVLLNRTNPSPETESLRTGSTQLGYVEGTNVVYAVQGALLSVDPVRRRVRLLPLRLA